MPGLETVRTKRVRISGRFVRERDDRARGIGFACRSRVDSFDDWTDWRRRLAELRHALDAHLDAADALAAKVSAASGADASPAGTDTPEAEWSGEVRRALEYLAAHYDRPLNAADLARTAGCSRDRLARLIRRETGLSLHAHLMRLRLAHAAREVRAGDKIEAVMLGVGYRGKRNFYRQFKARFGMTPGRWRAESTRGRR
jgi:AraC-like DNA-binding protein